MLDYELIDSGNEYKLERFGEYVLMRPDPNALWKPRLDDTEWKDRADVVFEVSANGHGKNGWKVGSVPESWIVDFGEISLECKLSPFKHTGIFPEQEANWIWCAEKIREFVKREGRAPRVLNLFGYTGAASLSAAFAGADVTHIDTSKPAVLWGKNSQKLSGLDDLPIRWLVDDCIKFAERALRRGEVFDAVIMDPPSFGRDAKKKVFRFEEDVAILLDLCKQICTDDPLFFLINAYSKGYSAEVVKNLLGDVLDREKIEDGELFLTGADGIRLPMSIYARYSRY